MDRDGKLKCNLNTTCGLTNSCHKDFDCQPGKTFGLAQQYAQDFKLFEKDFSQILVKLLSHGTKNLAERSCDCCR